MPDHHGFDHLPDWGAIAVACVEPDCGARGAQHEWPERARARHAASHERDRAKARRQDQRDREREAIARLRRLNSERAEARQAEREFLNGRAGEASPNGASPDRPHEATDTREGGTMTGTTSTKTRKRKAAGPKETEARTQREAKATEAEEGGTAEAAPPEESPASEDGKGSGKPQLADLAAAELKEAGEPLSATEIAKRVVAKHPEQKAFNVAFAIRAATRKGETFARTDDRPALYSLKS